MLRIKSENEKQKLINTLKTSRINKEETNNYSINLKMRKINKNTFNLNSENLRNELKKLLSDLHSSKSIRKRLNNNILKMHKLKLTPYQKIIKENQRTKKALSIKQKLLFKKNPLFNVEYKNFKCYNFNKTERSLNSIDKKLNKTSKKYFGRLNNLSMKAIKLPYGITSYTAKNKNKNKNFDHYIKEQYKTNKILNNKYNINNILNFNINDLFVNNRVYRNKNNLNIQNNSDAHSKLKMKISKKYNDKYFLAHKKDKSFNNEIFKDNIIPLSLISINRDDNFLYNTKKNTIIINGSNINDNLLTNYS
jgi:hypothetical protein